MSGKGSTTSLSSVSQCYCQKKEKVQAHSFLTKDDEVDGCFWGLKPTERKEERQQRGQVVEYGHSTIFCHLKCRAGLTDRASSLSLSRYPHTHTLNHIYTYIAICFVSLRVHLRTLRSNGQDGQKVVEVNGGFLFLLLQRTINEQSPGDERDETTSVTILSSTVNDTNVNSNRLPQNLIISTLNLPSNATLIRADITDSFSCERKPYGYYADVANDCQIFHVCFPVTYADGKETMYRWSFICPEETIFSQVSSTSS